VPHGHLFAIEFQPAGNIPPSGEIGWRTVRPENRAPVEEIVGDERHGRQGREIHVAVLDEFDRRDHCADRSGDPLRRAKFSIVEVTADADRNLHLYPRCGVARRW
jgi:hypothetical protein